MFSVPLSKFAPINMKDIDIDQLAFKVADACLLPGRLTFQCYEVIFSVILRVRRYQEDTDACLPDVVL